MKVCAIIAEYNPFHLGHLKQIEYVKNHLGAEKIIVIMSGNFTQRGEPAIMNKYKRAKQAILLGADAVIELPTIFAVSNAETFAFGAIKILDSLKIVDGICFGVESGKKEDYYALAKALQVESKEFKKVLKEKLESGISLAKAKFETVSQIDETEYDQRLISSPNNILGLEYTKAILKLNSHIDIYPLLREDCHNDVSLKKGITSAKSIREMIKCGKQKCIKKYLPKVVYNDIGTYPLAFEKIVMSKLLLTDADKLKNVPDCTEGLENRIKALAKDNFSVDELVKKVSTKRYTESRIRRILIGNLFDIDNNIIIKALDENLYVKVLAVNEKSNIINDLSKGKVCVLTRKSDTEKLSDDLKEVFKIDVTANDLYNLVMEQKENENQTLFI